MANRKKKKSWHKNKSFDQKDPVKAKKHLGQHFLKSEEVAEKIAHTLGFQNYANVLEIGPGTGVLTKYLLAQPIRLKVLELDRESIEYLKKDFAIDNLQYQLNLSNFEILEGDFLKYNLDTLFNGNPFAITGNFPYNISTQIVFKTLELKERIPEFTGMFQKEVAQRICAKEGNKTYGILSVLVQAFYHTELLFIVGPEVFSPPPKVESAVIRLKRKEDFTLGCSEKLLYRVVKTSFNQRRKTLRNSLKVFMLSDNLKEDTIFDRRPEELTVNQFVELTNKIANDSI
ncbi:16S rRNA (adenine(1518)-N(6)/adenine(1519)-N(6))-dimethyltransferase RsmA [Eudoraea chungangensis]|uniref:16S rRNA (adenine(1518)-N(6)/adenine(1519)-N(6))- dimethyltransferase RsmA n=1 Tax=Eudoraea chungangensis TaxID=1481905 RepID=UPI0023ED3CD1|nr:16S rRNA (adenine(1518)-N(6)/adenine(1519)-N(6))-dimethyltransferase RsmA [Eudoraea chungangensis]